MAQCITCGTELHPDRAEKYNYCMAPDCQRKNLKGLELVAVGVNKAAEQYLLRDQQTMNELASGKFADQRRGSFGTSLPSVSPAVDSGTAQARRAGPAARSAPAQPASRQPASRQPASRQPASRQPASREPALRRPAPPRPAAPPQPRRPWTRSQEKLALLYNEQGQRPAEIARKLGLSTYLVTQIILTSKNRGKL